LQVGSRMFAGRYTYAIPGEEDGDGRQ